MLANDALVEKDKEVTYLQDCATHAISRHWPELRDISWQYRPEALKVFRRISRKAQRTLKARRQAVHKAVQNLTTDIDLLTAEGKEGSGARGSTTNPSPVGSSASIGKRRYDDDRRATLPPGMSH